MPSEMRATFYTRIRSGKLFLLPLIFTAFWSFMAHQVIEPGTIATTTKSVKYCMLMGMEVTPVFLAFYTGMTLGSECTDSMWKNKIASGTGRISLITASLIENTIFTLFLVLLHLAVIFVVGKIKVPYFRMISTKFLITIGIYLLWMLFYVMAFVFLNAVLRDIRIKLILTSIQPFLMYGIYQACKLMLERKKLDPALRKFLELIHKFNPVSFIKDLNGQLSLNNTMTVTIPAMILFAVFSIIVISRKDI